MFYKEKLQYIRENQGILQKEIANILGVSYPRYNIYENEVEIIPINHLINLCNYFNVSIDYMFSFTDIKQYKNSINNVDKVIVGKRLKEFRKIFNITQVKLASILNIGNGTIADYERGRYLIATPFLYTICKKYNISADYLLGKIDNPKYF